MNFKSFCVLLSLVVFAVSCNQDDSVPFDHSAQYAKEKQLINTFLEANYYDADEDDILELSDEKIDLGKVSLKADDKLQALTTTLHGVNYTMYSYVSSQGTQESPDEDDKINVAYTLKSLTGTLYEKSLSNDLFLEMSNVIEGWKTGMTVFKAGESRETTLEEPRAYFDTGKGFIIVPSGLAYTNIGTSTIGANQTLVFKIELKTVIKQEAE